MCGCVGCGSEEQLAGNPAPFLPAEQEPEKSQDGGQAEGGQQVRGQRQARQGFDAAVHRFPVQEMRRAFAGVDQPVRYRAVSLFGIIPFFPGNGKIRFRAPARQEHCPCTVVIHKCRLLESVDPAVYFQDQRVHHGFMRACRTLPFVQVVISARFNTLHVDQSLSPGDQHKIVGMVEICKDADEDQQAGDQGGEPAPPPDLLFQRCQRLRGIDRGFRSGPGFDPGQLCPAFRAVRQVFVHQFLRFGFNHFFRVQGKKIPDDRARQFHGHASIPSFSFARARWYTTQAQFSDLPKRSPISR